MRAILHQAVGRGTNLIVDLAICEIDGMKLAMGKAEVLSRELPPTTNRHPVAE